MILASAPTILELHPICLPVGLPVSVSYWPSLVGIFGMVLVLSKVWLTLQKAYEAPILGL